jgi:hypothetical protein
MSPPPKPPLSQSLPAFSASATPSRLPKSPAQNIFQTSNSAQAVNPTEYALASHLQAVNSTTPEPFQPVNSALLSTFPPQLRTNMQQQPEQHRSTTSPVPTPSKSSLRNDIDFSLRIFDEDTVRNVGGKKN